MVTWCGWVWRPFQGPVAWQKLLLKGIILICRRDCDLVPNERRAQAVSSSGLPGRPWLMPTLRTYMPLDLQGQGVKLCWQSILNCNLNLLWSPFKTGSAGTTQ